eukprot:gene5146-34484_t
MGGGTTVLAAGTPSLHARASAVALWAPGLMGDPPAGGATAARVTAPALVMFGALDCLNAVVVLGGGDHWGLGGWATPAVTPCRNCVNGTSGRPTCATDACAGIPRAAQQLAGVAVYAAFARAACALSPLLPVLLAVRGHGLNVIAGDGCECCVDAGNKG